MRAQPTGLEVWSTVTSNLRKKCIAGNVSNYITMVHWFQHIKGLLEICCYNFWSRGPSKLSVANLDLKTDVTFTYATYWLIMCSQDQKYCPNDTDKQVPCGTCDQYGMNETCGIRWFRQGLNAWMKTTMVQNPAHCQVSTHCCFLVALRLRNTFIT